MLKLIKPDKVGIQFLYVTRTHPKVDWFLSGPPPENFKQHLKYLETNIDKFWILADEDGYFGYSQIHKDGQMGFVVHPDFQGRGFGRKLVILTIEKAKELNLDNLYLLVKIDNMRALRLYRDLGFKIKEIQGDEYYMELK